MTMAPRRCELWRRWIVSAGHPLLPSPNHFHLARALSWFLPFVSLATEAAGSHQFSSISNPQEADSSETKWHDLPPVPKQARRWTAWGLNEANINSEKKGSAVRDEEFDKYNGVKQITALQWATKCCPSLPSSLLHKLFRVRQVRQRSPLLDCQPESQSSDTPAIEQVATRMRRVSMKAVLVEGTVLYLPKSVFQNEVEKLPRHNSKKTEHQPTAAEFAWLHRFVLYKDAEIIVINKPPGLPVQGGSQIKKSLDSLMGSALSFDYNDGPRLVHRLDKDTSGLMILARTQECALLLHTLFREKTAIATESEDNTTIKRVYWALVIGTPRKLQGRISVPLIKVVLDEGKVDKIMVTHDFSSENAQVAITDYKVIGPSFHGCTWLELQPVTGRKHQLRVHCAEVLGTPVLGDMKYGWRTQKDWIRNMSSQNSHTFSDGGAAENTEGKYSEAVRHMKAVKGSLLNKEPLLHLHCREMVIPNVLQMLEKDRNRSSRVDISTDRLQFLAPLPPHMAASRHIWEVYTSGTSD